MRATGFTSELLRLSYEAAEGSGAAVAAATAAAESCIGLYSRVLSLATVSPKSNRTVAITPSLLALVGRELAARGEFVADIRVAGGRVRLIPAASSYVMTGDGDPSSWIYNLTTFGPSDSRTFMRHRDAVLHVLYGQTSGCPYAGVPPWASASLSGTLLAGIERQLRRRGRRQGDILGAHD